jgi:peptidoglycan/xylan/chitin deacetylase (PgdA/CDA1 family)
MNHVLIYTEATSNRLTYTFDLLLSDLLGLSYELTHDKDFFAKSELPKFSYAKTNVGDELFFQSVKLLFELNVHHQPILFCEHGNLKGFYGTPGNATLSFDLFASAFFMVSRYEEYLPSKKDKYDRYRGSQSMICKSGFLEKPMVNMYALELKRLLGERFPQLVFKKNTYRYLPTFDIDMAYAYLHKSTKRTIGGLARAFLFSELREVKERIQVLLHRKQDPYDTFDYIFKVLNRHRLPSIFFFLLANESRFDKNISPRVEVFRKLVKDIAQKTDTGIHLSFRSHKASQIESDEIARLEEITGQRTVRNRYHYLRFHISGSYLRLIEKEIYEDYSMGYAARAGFRAGICTPFHYFSLKTNEATPLVIYPIAFMDTTFVHYNRADAEEALERIRTIISNVKAVDGLLVGLWHNSSLSEQREWKGWTKVFETVALEAAPNSPEHA